MLKVGITGGMGSGKSTVCKIFELLGVPVFYADDEAKKLYNSNKELKSRIIENFGDDLYRDNIFNKNRMKDIVFNNAEKLQLLNTLVHPIVKSETEKWMKAQTAPYVIKEAALLIESGSYEQLDEIIFLECPIELRIKRVSARDASHEADIMKRIKAQMADDDKKKYATQIIINDEKQLLIPQVLLLHDHFLKKSAS